jgi:hypothetical protein
MTAQEHYAQPDPALSLEALSKLMDEVLSAAERETGW